MIRAVLIFSVVLVLALGAAWLADNPGLLVIEWQGVRIETSFTVGLVLFLFLFVASLIAFHFLLWLFGRTAALGSFFVGQRHRRAREALAKGFLAVAVGDSAKARRFVDQAASGDTDPSLLMLLRAQTADLSGQTDEAEKAYAEMAEAGKTRLAGLMGLMAHAKASGDLKTARAHAEKAFHLAPTAEPTFQALFALQVGAGEWQAARRTVETARRSGLLGQGAAARRIAVLMTAQANDLKTEGKLQAAASMAQRALSQSPDCLPAALLAADAFQKLGKRGRAATLIVNVWPRMPHPELGRVFTTLNTRENDLARWRRVTGLVELKREHPESRILFARSALDAKRYSAARDALRPLLEPAPTARVADLMAKLEEAETGNRDAAEIWHGKAAHAPRDALWRCRSCGRQAVQWTPVCPECETFDSQFWKSLGDSTLIAREAEAIVEDPETVDADEEDRKAFMFGLFGQHNNEKPDKEPKGPDRPAHHETHILTGSVETGDFTRAANDIEDKKATMLALTGPEDKKADDADETLAANGDATAQDRKERQEPVIYIAPRPPDDPGPSADPGKDPHKW